MKVNRNDPCYCGSGEKFKHCCGKGNSEVMPSDKYKTLLTRLFVILFFGVIIYGVVDWWGNRVEMELYKCTNPNCDQWHQRPKTSN